MPVWGLGKLILIYNSNGTTIEGNTDIAFREDVAARHEALGWHVQIVGRVGAKCADPSDFFPAATRYGLNGIKANVCGKFNV